MANTNLAAIDLGTNSCRLTIANPSGEIIYRDSIATKLGEGLYPQMSFTPQAIERGILAFEKYAQIMKNHQVKSYRAIATASCRMASNGVEFVSLVKQKSGINLEVIDGFEEARLNLKGALLNVPKQVKYAVVYDVGGGSTEITLATNSLDLQVLHTISIPWGGRNSAEAFSLMEFDVNRQQKLAKEIALYVEKFVREADLEKFKNQSCLLATSSTPLRLSSMVNQWGCYEREKGDGITVKTTDLTNVINEIYGMDLEQRKESLYIGENRAPIFISACTIFKTIYDGLGFEALTSSLKSAQDGIIKELIENGKTHKIS